MKNIRVRTNIFEELVAEVTVEDSTSQEVLDNAHNIFDEKMEKILKEREDGELFDEEIDYNYILYASLVEAGAKMANVECECWYV